jgi:hypothetical protein
MRLMDEAVQVCPHDMEILIQYRRVSDNLEMKKTRPLMDFTSGLL